MRFQLSDRGRLTLTALAVVIVMMAAITLAVVFVPARYLDRIQAKWVRFGVMTFFFICFSLRTYWRAHKSVGFWCIFLSFLALHLVGVGHLWAIYRGFSTIEVAVVGTAEWICMALVIYWVLGVGPEVRRHRSKSPWIPEL